MEGMMQAVRERLVALAEPSYAAFSARLIPGCENMLGVRLPLLRKLAKELVKTGGTAYIDQFAEPVYYEETMLLGMTIGAVKISDTERLSMIRAFVPRIGDWSVCDSFCAGLKAVGRAQEFYRPTVEELLRSEEEFPRRCGLVLLLDWYIDAAHIGWVLQKLREFSHSGYYAQMAAAWCGCEAFVRFPEETAAFLRERTLDPVTHKMTIRKICESRRVTEEQKKTLNDA
jgi:3-methyladenine DNA glycosylase AlkD